MSWNAAAAVAVLAGYQNQQPNSNRYAAGIVEWWNTWKQNTGRTDFGAVEYYEWLKANAPESGSGHNQRWGSNPNTNDLQWARRQFLDHHESLNLWEQNQRGGSRGLYEWVEDGEPHLLFRAARTAEEGQKFNEADYLAALATGLTPSDIIDKIEDKMMHIEGATRIRTALIDNRKENIKQVYRDVLGREADDVGLTHYLYGNESIEWIAQQLYGSQELQEQVQQSAEEVPEEQVQQSAEIITAENTTNDDDELDDLDRQFIIEGKGNSDFGDADYYELLKRVEPQGIAALKEVRQDVLDWIDNHRWKNDPEKFKKILWTTNQPGQSYAEGRPGLYDRIAIPAYNLVDPNNPGGMVDPDNPNFSYEFGDPQGDLDKWGMIEHGDILAAKAQGHSPYQIYKWMFRNKDKWDRQGSEYDHLRDMYNEIRGPLIERGNMYGNMYGYEGMGQTPEIAHLHYSWRNSLENPLWQEVGEYIRASGWGDNADKPLSWWMYDKAAYREIQSFFQDRSDNIDWLESHGGGLTTDEQLEVLIGTHGRAGTGTGTTGPTDWEEGDYWDSFGELGPRNDDGDLDLSKTMKFAVGIGMSRAGLSDAQILTKLESIEQKFLSDMYVGTYDESTGRHTGAKKDIALDSWGLDIVRVGYNPDDFESSWFTEGTDTRFTDMNWYQNIAFGDEDSIDWAWYAQSGAFQEAAKALGMEGPIDTIEEIRRANVFVQGYLSDPDSDLIDGWDPYEPQFDNTIPIPDPLEISVGNYTPTEKLSIDTPPDHTDPPSINIPNVTIERPSNLSPDLRIQGNDNSLVNSPWLTNRDYVNNDPSQPGNYYNDESGRVYRVIDTSIPHRG